MAADVAGAEMRSPPPASTVLMHACVLALALAPLVATSGLFLIDVPNHAFRSRLIMDLLNGKESTFYEFHLRLIPNLPIDVFAALTRNLLDPTIAVLALTCVACAGFYLSVVWWRWSRGRPTRLWMCLLLVLVLYSKPLYFGLINYILALAIMNVGLARLETRAEHPWIGFSASQTVLVLLMYLCSLFAVVLYFSWSLGTALFDGLSGPERHFRDVVRRDARIHLPPVLIIFGVILMANPVPPAEAARNTWAIDLKFAALGSIGRMSNLPHELLFSLLVFSLLGFGLWIGALRIRPRLLAGLCGMIASFIIVPGKLLGATLIDMRMAMAIAAASLAVLQEAPAAVGSRVEAFRNLLVAAAVAARLALLTVFWTPLQPLNSVYSELARLIEDGSAVFFVAPQDERESVDFWHLHMLAFSGRDVHLSQMFFNFTVDLKPTARFRAPETPVNGRLIADVLSTDPYAYVLSHEDLSTLHISGKRLCLLREHSSVRLYRTLSAPQAGSAKPTSCESD